MSHPAGGPCLIVMNTSTARIPLVDDSNLLVKAMNWYTRRQFGAVMEPALAMAHNRKVLTSTMRFQSATNRWDAMDGSLKHLAALSAAATVGCSWCLDFGYWVSFAVGSRRSPTGATATSTPTSSGG